MRFDPSSRLLALASAAILAALPAPSAAQSLRGSPASINRMYRQAKAEHLAFYETSGGVRKAASAGKLVRLQAGDDVQLHDIGYPFVRPAARTFVQRLAEQYREACGEPLVVTSAVRPATRQPANSTERSVHPTGMAIDLRKPASASCLRWLREALLDLEDRGLIEATEEHWPAHFHVAVFPTPYTKYVAERKAAVAVADASTYVVRAGDTLWEIAREHDVTVKAIVRANGLAEPTIVPGQELVIPGGD
jgi:hypothetical protein